MSRFRHVGRDPFGAAAEALLNFRRAGHAEADDVRAALLGYRLDLGKQGRLADGPLRLVVLTPTSLVSSDPHDGRALGSRPVTQLAGYFASTDGKLLMRFDGPHGDFPPVAAFRPMASGISAGLSPGAAGYEFLRLLIEAWEGCTGKRFVNGWSPASPFG